MRENWDRQREAGSSSAQGLGGVSKKGPVMTGRAKESPLQSGDQLTLEMRSTIPSLVSLPCLRLLLPKLSDHTHLVEPGLWTRSFALLLTIPSYSYFPA